MGWWVTAVFKRICRYKIGRGVGVNDVFFNVKLQVISHGLIGVGWGLRCWFFFPRGSVVACAVSMRQFSGIDVELSGNPATKGCGTRRNRSCTARSFPPVAEEYRRGKRKHLETLRKKQRGCERFRNFWGTIFYARITGREKKCYFIPKKGMEVNVQLLEKNFAGSEKMRKKAVISESFASPWSFSQYFRMLPFSAAIFGRCWWAGVGG